MTKLRTNRSSYWPLWSIAVLATVVMSLTFASLSTATSASATSPDTIDLNITIPDAGTTMNLPLLGTYTGVTIDWGDGTLGPGTVKSHVYAAAGDYSIAVSAPASGTIGFGISNPFAVAYGWVGAEYVTSVTDWNYLNNLKGGFSGAVNLRSVPNYLPPSVTIISYLFNRAENFNSDISGWNTANVTFADSMFNGATSFNQDIGNWNTSNITTMQSMFSGATSFNQDISRWNTSRVTSLLSTFVGATSFNQPLDTWNTSAVTTMANTFAGATSFNQPLANWNTSNVVMMGSMFYGATSFNQPLSNWNVAKVVNFDRMFYGATAFNQPLSGWNTISANTLDYIFQGATSFDRSLATWNIKTVYPVSVGRILTGSSISAPMLSATLQGWARGWTVGATTYTVPRSVTTAWRLNYVGDTATLAAVSTLTTTYAWNLSAETSSRMVSYAITPGTGTTPRTTAVAIANPFAVAQPTGFSRPGYTFTNWTDGSGTYVAGANYPAGSTAVSLAAQWAVNTLTVTLDARNGSPATTITTQTDAQISAEPAAPTRTGYTFAGWFTSANGGNRITFPYAHGQTSDFTLYAQWTGLPQTISYGAGAGAGTPPTQADAVSGGSFVVADASLLSKTGYFFAGWTDGTSTYQPGATYTVGTSAVTLTATWSASSLTVTLNPSNGASLSTQTTHTDEQILVSPIAPSMTGHRFLGWFTSADGGSVISFPYTHGRTSNFTLYAHWALIPTSQISFTVNGGIGDTPAPIVLAVGSRLTIMGSMAISRAGYVFAGWSDGTNFYAPDSQIVVGPTNITLAAQWQAEAPVSGAGGSTEHGVPAVPSPEIPPLPVSETAVKLAIGSSKPTRSGQASLSSFIAALSKYQQLSHYKAVLVTEFSLRDSSKSGSAQQTLLVKHLALAKKAFTTSGLNINVEQGTAVTNRNAKYSKIRIELVPKDLA